jgi:hypothetical protein
MAATIHLVKFLLLLMIGFLCAFAARAAEFDHTYTKLNQALSQHVQEGSVNYAALKGASRDLQAALAEMAAVKKTEFNQWPQSQQIAFLINLYNASTLRLILDHYPIKSIKDIGNILRGPFKQRVVRLFGETTTLDYVEHEMLRANYREPRVHFALVCAAKSCPPLRSEAFVSPRLGAQLDDQGSLFLGDRAKNRFDAESGVLYLSPIFKWFREDFEKSSGSVVKFVSPFFPADTRNKLKSVKSLEIRHTDYDWSLNEKPR